MPEGDESPTYQFQAEPPRSFTQIVVIVSETVTYMNLLLLELLWLLLT